MSINFFIFQSNKKTQKNLNKYYFSYVLFNTMSDFVYIIGNNDDLIKVGISKNPTKRVKQLQTGNGHKLTLLFTEEFECTRQELLKIEKKIHSDLSHLCTKKVGEWFKINSDILDRIKNTIIWHRIRYDN